MQWLWLIPSLAFGVYLFFTTGQAYGLIFGGFAAVSALLGSVIQNRKQQVDNGATVRVSPDAKNIAIGDTILPKAQWRWQPAWRTTVYRHFETLNSQRSAALAIANQLAGSLAVGPGSAFLGFTGANQLTVDLAQEGAHAIVVGATGSGKSQLLTTWLVSLCQSNPPETLQIVAIDYKGGAALAELAGTPWCAGLHTDISGTAPVYLAGVQDILKERENLCLTAGVSRVSDLPASQRVPNLYLVIDELQALLADPNLQRPLEAVAARGRSLGVHIIATAQSLSGVSRGLLANLGLRIAVGKSDPVDLAQLGYSRAEGSASPLPEATTGFGGSPTTSNPLDLGDAILISPKRQVRFRFPSGGAVSLSRIKTEPKLRQSLTQGPFENEIQHEKATIPADFVETAPEKFVFRIGL
jgi:hypothetical protein